MKIKQAAKAIVMLTIMEGNLEYANKGASHFPEFTT
jgi:hypothetical protein